MYSPFTFLPYRLAGHIHAHVYTVAMHGPVSGTWILPLSIFGYSCIGPYGHPHRTMHTTSFYGKRGTKGITTCCTIAAVLLITATCISAYEAHLRLGSGADAPYHYGCRYPITNLTLYKPLLLHYIPQTKFPSLRYRRRRRYARKGSRNRSCSPW